MTPSLRQPITRILYFAALAGIVLCYFYRVLSCREIFVERDLSAFFIPPKMLWVSLLKGGTFPFWNAYQYCGIPLLAALQPGVLYPPHVFYLFLPFQVVWNWLIILHFLLAGVAVYSFLKYVKSSEEGAFVGAVIFMLSGYLLSVHNLLPHLFAVAWFPLVLLSVLKYFESKQTRHAVFASLFLLMQFLSGAPEILMMSVLAVFIVTLFLPSFGEERVSFYARMRAFVVILSLFLLLSAVQLLPFYELKAQSIRQGGLTYFEASVWSMAWRDFIQFFIPDPFGNLQNDQKYWQNQSWLKTIYLGIVPFFLSAFFFVSRDKRRWLFALLMVISLIFALGGNTPIYKLLYKIPPFSSVRYPVKFLFLFFFVISVTSGIGLDRLKKGVRIGDRRTQKVILVAFYMGFLFALLWSFMTVFRPLVEQLFDHWGFKPDVYNLISVNIHDIRRFSFFAFLFCVLLLLYLRVARKRLIMGLITGVLILDLFLANYGYYSRIEWQAYVKEHPFSQAMLEEKSLDRYFVTPKTHKAYDRFPGIRAILGSAFAPIFGLYTADGAEVLRLNSYENFIQLVRGASTVKEAARFFDVAGIRYLISTARLEEQEFTLLSQVTVNDNPVYLYEYSAYPGRFLLFSRVKGVPDEKSMIEKLLDRTIDLRQELIVLSKGMQLENAKAATDKVEVVSYQPNHVVLKCETGQEAFLYVSDTFYPGWRAYVDGKRTEIVRANLAFRAVRVPQGGHTVSFRYVPISFYAGLVLTVIGLILALFLVIKRR
jgi:hypothetical protein